MKLLRDRGYIVDVVERVVPKTFIRKDMFGCIDLMALGESGEVVAVQATTGDGGAMAARERKIRDSEAFERMIAAGWKVLVIGWRKNSKGRWVCREVDVS